MNEIILDIIKFSVPALIVFFTVFLMLRFQFKKEEKMRFFELKKKHSKESLPIRLQAYERLTLFMYRIAPENLIPRTQNASLSVKSYTYNLLKTIKSEFEHNITQQVYVSSRTWDAIEVYKDKLISLIKEKSLEANPNDPCLALSELILNHIIENPNILEEQEVNILLKKEVKEMFL